MQPSLLQRDCENKSAFAVPTPPKRLRRLDSENKPKQSQFPIILVFLNRLCIISFSVMVIRRGGHSMPNGRNFDCPAYGGLARLRRASVRQVLMESIRNGRCTKSKPR